MHFLLFAFTARRQLLFCASVKVFIHMLNKDVLFYDNGFSFIWISLLLPDVMQAASKIPKTQSNNIY